MITSTNDPRYQQRLWIAALAALAMLLASCGTSYRWVAVPIKTKIVGGIPSYVTTGRPMPIDSAKMDGQPGILFKKVKQ